VTLGRYVDNGLRVSNICNNNNTTTIIIIIIIIINISNRHQYQYQ